LTVDTLTTPAYAGEWEGSTMDVPAGVRSVLLAAGWHPDRRVVVSPSIPVDHPAAGILAALGGLTVVPDRTAGEECAPHHLAFRELWPDESITRVWNVLLGTDLIGVAEVDHGHGELYVAGDGRCFGQSCVHTAFYFVGGTFAEALERSLIGLRSRPMLRPNQQSVTLYGIRHTACSPELYRYA
jgi:hypothetical protein